VDVVDVDVVDVDVVDVDVVDVDVVDVEVVTSGSQHGHHFHPGPGGGLHLASSSDVP
jgi:hypothetical protein